MKKTLFRRFLSLTLSVATALSLAIPAMAIEPPDSVQCTKEEEQKVWDFLMELTKNPVGAAGIMGNLFYESHLASDNLETMGKRPPEFEEGEDYTSATDNGTYRKFTSDGFGYGIAQWTFGPRKRRLMEIAHEEEKSIANLDVQLMLLAEELEKYNMLDRIRAADSLTFVAKYVLVNFENPQNQGDKEVQRRAKKARYYYDKYYHDLKLQNVTEAQKQVANVAIYSDAYGVKAEAGLCQAWATGVLQAAGFPKDKSASAEISAKNYGVSEDMTHIPVGAAVYGHSSSKYGHVGIYVGNNQVYHNVGGVQVDSLEDWIANYQGFCWGWIGGTDLSKIKDKPY